MVDHVSSGKSVQNIKDTDNGDSECNDASKVLEKAYSNQHYTMSDKLTQGGVSLTIKNIPAMVDSVSFEKAIQNMKDNWDPMCDDASKALQKACRYRLYGVCDLLVQNGVSLTMNNLPDMVVSVSFEYIKKTIQNMKDTNIWDVKCHDASIALEKAYKYHKYDMCDLLVQEGVSLRMRNLPDLVCSQPLKTVKKIMQHLKETDNWDPKCADASEALENAYRHQKFDVCDLLAEEGVSLTMKTLLHMACSVPFHCIKKAIQTMKDTDNWDLNCEDASEELAKIYTLQKYDVCDLLIHKGVSIMMKNLLDVVYSAQLESVQKALQHLEYTDKWDPKCDDAAEAFVIAFRCKKYGVCDLLVEEGVELTMKNLTAITGASDVSYKVYDDYFELEDEDSLSVENPISVIDGVSLEYIKKTIQNVKDNGNWDPKCDDASKAFENAYELERYNVCDLLVQEGVSLTVNNLPRMVVSVSFENIKKAIQNMKDSDNWDPKCDDVSKALDSAYRYKIWDVYDLLFKEEVSLTMKNLSAITGAVSLSLNNRSSMVDSVSFEYITKTIHCLKDTKNWDPKSTDASEALENAFRHQRYDVCDLLVQEGVSLAMNNICNIVCSISIEYIRKAVHTMKENDN
ncbi:hypothetical protein CHS0354_016371 [Potamilus streckersoni]|uniref:Uncharacterized protein n=1 Tax=Potamilus streckersoni TaxID=2493646 RepID=A0AAE0W1Z0_9BIVA|nr:hypothetical protein CHS0354_016371 [Potamilus streckersoni]